MILFNTLSVKRNIYIAILAICIVAGRTQAQTYTAYDTIALLNLDHYETLPVDSLLHAIPQSYNDIGLYGRLKNNRVSGLSIRYPNGTQILVKPKLYMYMNPIDPNRIWNILQFKLERAHYILVISDQGSLCGSE